MIRTSIVHFLHSLPSQSSPIQFWCECHWQVMQLWFSFIYLQECPINHNLVFTLTKHLNLNRVNEWCNLLRVIYISISYKFLYITKNLITPYSTCKYRSYWSTLWDQRYTVLCFLSLVLSFPKYFTMRNTSCINLFADWY